MKSDKIKKSIGPISIVLLYITCSFLMSGAMEFRSWESLMVSLVVEIIAFFLIAASGFNLNKARALCAILTIQICYISLYILASWAYVNTALVNPFKLFYFMNQPFSIAISFMLVTASLLPPRILDDLATRFRIDLHLHRFNMRVGLYIFSTNKDVQWKH